MAAGGVEIVVYLYDLVSLGDNSQDTMKKIVLILFFALIGLTSSSCLTLALLPVLGEEDAEVEMGSDFGKRKAKMKLKTFQRVDKNAALATTGNGDVVCVVAVFGEYYDGMVISGTFLRHGTYSYISTKGANKEVLTYVYKKHYRQLSSYRIGERPFEL